MNVGHSYAKATSRARVFYLFVLGLAFLATAAIARAAAPESVFSLEMEVASDRPTALQLFYDTGQFWSGIDSVRIAVPASADFQTVRFALPAEPVKRLRLDPSDGAVVLRLRHLRLVATNGTVIKEIPAAKVLPMAEIADVSSADGVATVQTIPQATDPQLLIGESIQSETTRILGRSIASPAGLMTLVTVALLGALFVLWTVFDAVVRSGATRSKWVTMMIVGAFLVIAGERLWWLLNFASPVPFWDEWASDWLYLLGPLPGGDLEWRALFVPQSEHRIIVTRLITIGTAILSGEWDPRVGMTVSVVLWGLGFSIVAGLLVRAARWIGILAAVALIAVAAQPIDFSNMFWGGQSQMYALVLFMICCLTIASVANPTAKVFAAAILCGALSLGTMGSGLLAPLVAAGVCAWRAWVEPAQRRRLLALGAIFLAAAVVGLLLRTDSRFHSAQYAKTTAQFFWALFRFGAWPLPAGMGWWLVRNGPWLVQCLVVAKRRSGTVLDWFSIGLGAWVLADDCGLSYGRPWMSSPADPRHFTALFLGTASAIVNSAALLSSTVRPWLGIRVVVGLLGLAAVVGIVPICRHGIDGARGQTYWNNAHEAVVYSYLSSGDLHSMEYPPSDAKAPYWNSTDLAVTLDDARIWPTFPASLKKRLAAREGGQVAHDISAGWITIFCRSLMKIGAGLFAAGVVVIAAGVFWRTRSFPES